MLNTLMFRRADAAPVGQRFGRATVIHTGAVATGRTATAQRTQRIPYTTLAREASAWAAEMRARRETPCFGGDEVR